MLTNATIGDRKLDMLTLEDGSGIVMSEEESTTQHERESAALEDEANLDLDERWKKLQQRGLVKGPRPRREDRVDPSTMRPIRYHGTNEDLMRDLSRCP